MVASSFLTKALVPAFLFSAQVALAQGTCAVKSGVSFTFFGLGSAGVYTKFGCSGTSVKAGSETATGADGPHPSGGDGSYDHPALFATAATNTAFQRCEIIYIPYFKKYFQYGDICAQCETDFGNGLTKIDLWIGPNPQSTWTDQSIPQSAKGETATCEGAWGAIAGKDIVHNPPTNLEVQSLPLDDGTTCYNTDTSRSFPTNAGSCTGGSSSGGSSPPASSPSPPAPTIISPPANTGGSVTGGQVKAVVNNDTPPTQPSASSSPPAPQPPPVVQKLKVVAPSAVQTPPTVQNLKVNTPPAQSTVPTAPQAEVKAAIPIKPAASEKTTTAPPPSTNTTGQPGDQCPPGGWFEGCVWGSGAGEAGATCTAKADCHGDFICVAGKCTDNTHDKLKVRAVRGIHMRRAHKHLL